MGSRKLNQGRKKIRDFLKSEADKIAVGTDETAVSQTDSSLGSQVYSESCTSENEDTGTVRHTVTLNLSEANTNTLEEAGIIDTDGDLTTRHVFAAIEKNDSTEIEIIIREKNINPEESE